MSLENATATMLPKTDEIPKLIFGWMDCTLFGALLLISLLIGLYFGFCSKQDNTTEYLLGGKTMSYFPVAMSMIAGHVSGVTLLGLPAEVYEHGSVYAALAFTALFSCFLTAYVYLPVFYGLQLTSTFEYLEIRFARSVRTLCAFLYILSLLLYMPIVVYVPAIAFAQVTKLSLHTITPVLCIVCIVYTSVGGIKAVIWTDTVQFTVTIGSLFTVLFLGMYVVGGAPEVWRIAEEGGRLILFDMDPSPFARNSFWGMTIGVTIAWLGHLGISQNCVQRFLSVPTEIDARKVLVVTSIGLVIIKLISVVMGLLIYAKYHECDPLLSKTVDRSDQLLPYYVMDVAGNIPGLPGLFLAGLVSAALATMSASLNTLAGAIYEDFVEYWIPEKANKEKIASNIMKVICVIAGFITIGVVFVIEYLGAVFKVAMSIRSMIDGPVIGLFTLGMVVPWCNTQGALLGGWTSLITMIWLVGGTQWHIFNNRLYDHALPSSIENCPYPLNETVHEEAPVISSENEPSMIFKVSFLYLSFLGTLITIVVGTVGSYILGKVDLATVNPQHITPIMRRFLPLSKFVEIPLSDLSFAKGHLENERNKFIDEDKKSDELIT